MAKDPRKKICVIGPALTMGGMERASINLANSLNSYNLSVTYIAVLKQNHFFKLNEGIKFFEPSDFNTKKMSIFRTLKWLRKCVKEEKPNAIIVYNKFYSALALLSLIFTSYKVYISERSSPLYKWPLRFRVINRLAFSLKPPTGIIAQTNIAAKYQRLYYGNKPAIKVIPNALREISLFPEVQREKVILAVGRLNEALKGFDRLIEAFGKVNAPGWKLVFAGGNESGEYLKKRAKELDIFHKVEFLGAVSEIDEVYAYAGIFVIPSRSEGFPNALCEAMAAGLACISFDFIAGPRDIIVDGENGFLVKDGDIDGLANKIQFLIENEKERTRLGKNALNLKNRLHSDIIGKEYLNFILQ